MLSALDEPQNLRRMIPESALRVFTEGFITMSLRPTESAPRRAGATRARHTTRGVRALDSTPAEIPLDRSEPEASARASAGGAKRAFDVVVTLLLLVPAFPFLLVSALLVKLTSRGPIFFGHTRLGLGGRTFRCLKFRTMVDGAEAWLDADPELKARHRRNGFKLPRGEDPRVTKVGRFLRYTHLDELPQLLNVLRGDMSLVGPRPIVTEELEHYGDWKDEFLSIRPGIFGPWTAKGGTRPGYPERAEVELSYPRSRSGVWGDLIILIRNLPVLLNGQEEGKP